MECVYKMKRKKIFKRVLLVIGLIMVLALTVPLLIPITGETGLNEPKDLLTEGTAIVSIPFEGTDGIDIFYEYNKKEDSDKNFILLHGSLYNSKTWSEVYDYFSGLGNVYAYDQLPYGFSEKILDGEWEQDNPYTTDSAVKQLKQFMDEMGIKKATLVGSSFGGVLAAEASIRYEENVEALILVAPAIMVTESMPKWLVDLPQAEHIGPLFAKSLSLGNSFYESTFFDKDLITAQRMEHSKRETKVNNWNLSMWEYLQAWSTEPSDVSNRLEEIKKPTLIISGRQDSIVPLEDSEKIASRILNAELAIIEECGHMPHEEKPEEFIEIVNQWLN